METLNFKEMKKGTYVSRSTYQKVAEENKKLKADIKTLVGELSVERILLSKKWQDHFKKEEDFYKKLKEIALLAKADQ